MNTTSKVAVCSRSFSQHPILRAELLKLYSHIKFNDEGMSLAGDDLAKFLQGHDKAIVALEKIDAELLENLPELKVIGKYGVGLDKIDFRAMDDRNIKLGWTPGVNARAVAELTLAMALVIVRNIHHSNHLVKSHGWKQIKGFQLSSMTYGILGCGHVGRILVQLLKPFGCKILACDTAERNEFYKEYNVEAVDLETLLKKSNILSIHIPKNTQTEKIINRDAIFKMQKGSYLINTARGGLVDEVALLEALNSGHLSSVALDVFEEEPSPRFDLIDHPNVFTTSHIGGSSEEAILAMGRAAIKGLDNYQKASLYE